MKRIFSVALFLTLAAPAGAGEPMPSLDEVLHKTHAVMDRQPDGMTCKLTVDTELLDKTGKVEHHEHREGVATLKGDEQEVDSQKIVRDGRTLSADEVADEREKLKRQNEKNKKKKATDNDFDLSPLAPKNAPHEQFTLAGKDTLWGHTVYVLDVKAKDASPTHANGRLWIDADTFVELKGELSPSAMPTHADWIKVQEQYVPGPKGVPAPAFLHIEGAGHLLFLHKQFRTTLRYHDCR